MIDIQTGDKWTDTQIRQINDLFLEIAKGHPHGLVLMKFTDSPAPWHKDDIAGLEPEQAAKMFRFKMAFPCDRQGEPIKFSGIKKSEQAEPASSNAVQIPSDWEDMHHLQQIRLAKEISDDDSPLTAEEAREIIRTELQRRGDT
jgi:hypothetical protein